MGELIGALIAVSLISVLFRFLLVKFLKIQKRTASIIAPILAIIFSCLAAYPQMGVEALIVYPIGGLVAGAYLYFDLPLLGNKKKG